MSNFSIFHVLLYFVVSGILVIPLFYVLFQALSDTMSEEKSARFIKRGMVITIAIFFAFCCAVELLNSTYLKKGDYSAYQCEDLFCGQSATYKLHSVARDYYYCEDHLWEAKNKYAFFISIGSSGNGDSSRSDTLTCNSCGRSFEAGSSSFSSIRKTGMCTSCYNNFKWGEQFIGK